MLEKALKINPAGIDNSILRRLLAGTGYIARLVTILPKRGSTGPSATSRWQMPGGARKIRAKLVLVDHQAELGNLNAVTVGGR
ncbi:MAG: hypothetical protein R3F38_12195 [Gammaproteobacteria bacterium]